MDSKTATCQLARELRLVRKSKIRRLKLKIATGKYHIKNEDVVRAIFLAN